MTDIRRHSLGPLAQARLAAAFLSVSASVAAMAEDRVLLSYEATPSVGFTLPGLARATCDDRAAFSQDVLTLIVPKILAANGIDPEIPVTEVTPGGYLLKTNTSLQTEGVFDDTTADRLAAALGYVFHQYSVLVSRLDDTAGTTRFVVVKFPKDSLDATVAQRFFEQADARAKGLGGSYTAFGDRQIFLNVKDADGKADSGLDGAAFLEGLKRTASAFGDPTSPLVRSLDGIGRDYAALVEATAVRKGWT